MHLHKILVVFACRCTSVNPVKNMQVVILKAVEDDLANVESTLACKASAKHKSMHTSNSIVTSSGVR